MNTENPSDPVSSEKSQDKKGTSRLALSSLICSMLFFLPLVPLAGLIMGMVFLFINKGKKLGQGMAIAGVIIGFFSTFMLQGIVLAVAIPAFKNYVEKAREMEGVPEERVVQSSDGMVEITAPKHWLQLDELHEDASLKLGNKQKEQYFIILTDSKLDYTGTLDDHAALTTERIINNIKGGSRSTPRKTQIAGFDAVQYNIDGTLQNHTNIHYLHTTIDGALGYHQLLCWTTPSKKETAMPICGKVLQTFREVKGAGPVPSKQPAPTNVPKNKIVTSLDAGFSLQVPDAWSVRKDLMEEANLQVADAVNNMFLVVLSYKKSDIDNTFEKYAEETSKSSETNIVDAKRTLLGKQTINGHNAIQYKVQGAVDQIKLAYLLTFIEGDNAFHYVLAWTVLSNEESGFKEFNHILTTFKEQEAAKN